MALVFKRNYTHFDILANFSKNQMGNYEKLQNFAKKKKKKWKKKKKKIEKNF